MLPWGNFEPTFKVKTNWLAASIWNCGNWHKSKTLWELWKRKFSCYTYHHLFLEPGKPWVPRQIHISQDVGWEFLSSAWGKLGSNLLFITHKCTNSRWSNLSLESVTHAQYFSKSKMQMAVREFLQQLWMSPW